MKNILNARVTILVFNDNSGDECGTLAYCPELNLLAYGKDSQGSIEELECIMEDHFDYVVENGTMCSDLLYYGWIVENGMYTPPSSEYMMENDEIYREIITSKKYETFYRSC